MRRVDSDRIELASVGAGLVLCAIVLLLVCLPAGALLASKAGQDPVSTLLLLRSDAAIGDLLARPGGALTYGDFSLIAALLALYGSVSLTLPLLYFVARHEGYFKILSLSWGMFLGLGITSYWYEWASTGELGLLRSYSPKIAYLYLAFFIAEGGKTLLERRGLAALPYLYVTDGVFGIVSVLIISAGYPATFADLLLGPLFLVAVAAGILAGEWLVMRPMSLALLAIIRMVRDTRFARRFRNRTASDGLRLFRRRLTDELKRARGLDYGARADLIDTGMGAIFLQGNKDARPAGGLNMRILLATFLGTLAFPVLAGLLAWVIL